MDKSINSLSSFIDWLKTKPAKGAYNYCDPHNCLLHQYFTEKGLPVKCVGAWGWEDSSGVEHEIPKDLHFVAEDGQDTYGAALLRAKTPLV